MATDPYHEVQSEIQGTLQSATALLSSYRRIRSTARDDSEELGYARSELKATLSALEADLDDLEESVKVVEDAGARLFGLADAEVNNRRRFVSQVRHELESMRREVSADEGRPSGSSAASSTRYGSGPGSSSSSTPKPGAGRPSAPSRANTDGEGEDDQSAWSRVEQQMLIREQDKTLDSITGTVKTIAEQAGLMNREIGEHVELLEDLERGVDTSQTKLTSGLKRIKKFIRDTEETKSGWCIGILIVILMILLLMVILL